MNKEINVDNFMEYINPENILREDFYSELYYFLYEYSIFYKIEYNELYLALVKKIKDATNFAFYMTENKIDDIKDMFYTDFDDDILKSSLKLIKLLLFPLVKYKISLKNKTYKDYNIELKYFLSMIEKFNLISFNFNKEKKLSNFSFKNDIGMVFNYNDSYEVKSVKFIDDKEEIRIQ